MSLLSILRCPQAIPLKDPQLMAPQLLLGGSTGILGQLLERLGQRLDSAEGLGQGDRELSAGAKLEFKLGLRAYANLCLYQDKQVTIDISLCIYIYIYMV